jgi:hypothetical protein
VHVGGGEVVAGEKDGEGFDMCKAVDLEGDAQILAREVVGADRFLAYAGLDFVAFGDELQRLRANDEVARVFGEGARAAGYLFVSMAGLELLQDRPLNGGRSLK